MARNPGHTFDTLDYLARGTARQRELYGLIRRSGVFEALVEFSPVLAGTFPLSIEVEGSDLDVLCHAPEPVRLQKTLERYFSRWEGYACERLRIKGVETVVGWFRFEGMVFEVFGQPVPVRRQNGYRHMVDEEMLLRRKGGEFRHRIVARKRAGEKTEPAFAAELSLEGDPYEALLELEKELKDE